MRTALCAAKDAHRSDPVYRIRDHVSVSNGRLAWSGRRYVNCRCAALSSPHLDWDVRMGDRTAVISGEQRAVNHAYACYEQKLAKNHADHRFLVLPYPPAKPWTTKVMRETFRISGIRRTEDDWAGHLIEVALGTGVAAPGNG